MTDKSTIAKIPNQVLEFDKKNEEWRKDTVDAYVEMSTFDRSSHSRHKIKNLYDYYNGKMNKQDYKYVLQPYGGPTRKNVPADLKRYNIIKPIVDVLIGEKSRRPDYTHVISTNPDSVSIKEEEQQRVINESLADEFYASLQQSLGVDVGQEELSATVEEKVKFFQRNYTDIRTELGQHAFNFIKQYCETYDKSQKAWHDFLVSGECYAFTGINHNEPEYMILNPLDVDYDKDPDLEMVEDGNWVVIRRLMSASSIIDIYYDELSREDVEYLEDPQFNRESFLTFSSDEIEDRHENNEQLIEVMQVYWKSKKKIGFLDYMDEFGEPQTEIVDEEYIPDENEDVEWLWVNEVWEGHRIDDEIYVRMQPLENQRRSMDNPSKCKLPVNGRKYSDRNSENISLVSLGIPYQLMYDIYKYRLELSIAKSKDVIGEFDLSTIPADWDLDKFMYYMEATGIAWTDYSQEGVKANPQLKRALDLSVKTIEQYIALLQSIREEWEQASGVTRQRQGQMSAYEGKGVTEQSIVQSTYITEDYFRKFAQFEERNYQALMDYSKEAWENGKKGTYLMPDGTQQFFEADPERYAEAEYGVFMSSARKDVEKLHQLKGMAQAFAQNGADLKAVADILDSESMAGLKRKIDEAEERQQEFEQAMQEAEQQAQQAELQDKQAERELNEMQNIRDNQTKIEEALIKAETEERTTAMKLAEESNKNDTDTALERKRLLEEIRSNKVDESLKRLDINVKKIAAKKKNTN